MPEISSSDDVPARLRAIREATGMTQKQFRAALARAGLTRTQGQISSLENGGKKASLDELAAYAVVDPLKRGRLWVAWGDAPRPSGVVPGADGRADADWQTPEPPATPVKRRRAR